MKITKEQANQTRKQLIEIATEPFGTQPIAFGGLFKIKKIDNKVKL